MFPRKAALLCLVTALAPACDDAVDRADAMPDPVGGKADGFDAGMVPILDEAVMLFDGYNSVVDAPLGRNCVVPESGRVELAEYRVGSDVITSDLQFISNREELEKALDITGKAKLKVGPVGAGGSFGLAKKYKSSETSIAILLKVRHEYTVINQEEHLLTDEALELLETDPAQFARSCGTHYAAGVSYGAELVLLIQIEAESVEDSLEVKADLEANGIVAGPVNIDPGVGAGFKKALTKEGVRTNVSVHSRGFVPGTDVGSLLSGTIDEEDFARLAQAVDELRASVLLDECHDQGEFGPGQCDGTPARGYLGNGARKAVPLGLLALPHRRTANILTHSEATDNMVELERRSSEAGKYLRFYADILDELDGYYRDEVQAALDADEPYTFAPYRDPSEPLETDIDLGDVRETARAWSDLLDPRNGALIELAIDAAERCWVPAQFGDFDACQDDPETAPEYEELQEAIAAYAEDRIRPVYYTALERRRWNKQAGKCGEQTRMATHDEMTQLWLAVRNDPDVSSPRGDQVQTSRAIWYDDLGQDCADNEGAFIELLQSGEFATGCYENRCLVDGLLCQELQLPAMCVPEAGPFGSRVPEL